MLRLPGRSGNRIDRMVQKLLIAGLVAWSSAAIWSRAAELQLEAGIAKVEITPSSFMQMYGYANRKCGPANGTHDPLFAKVLVLATGESRMAIVTLDLGSIVSQNLEREVAVKLAIPVLLLSASHTHSGPLFLPSEGSVRGITPSSFEPSPVPDGAGKQSFWRNPPGRLEHVSGAPRRRPRRAAAR